MVGSHVARRRANIFFAAAKLVFVWEATGEVHVAEQTHSYSLSAQANCQTSPARTLAKQSNLYRQGQGPFRTLMAKRQFSRFLLETVKDRQR